MCGKVQSGRSSVQLLEWQPLLATKLNCSVFIWCIGTWDFWIVVDKMVHWAVDISKIMQYLKPNKSCGKRKVGMTSRTQSANLQRSDFSCTESGMEVHMVGLPKFLLWKSFFICHWLCWYFCRFMAKHMSTVFSQVSSMIASLCVKIIGKGSEFSSNQHWNRTSRSYFWTSQHCW